MKPLPTPTRVLAPLLLAALPMTGHTAFIQNGSLENLSGTWAQTSCNYMALGAGSTAIDGWTVATSGGRTVVWGRETTCDGHTAPDGAHFVDLSGFGTLAGLDAALWQTMSGLLAGETYSVSLRYLGATPGVEVDGIDLSAVGGSSGWTAWSGQFVATGTTATLTLRNRPSGGFVFVDDVRVSGPAGLPPGTVPVPGSLPLGALALALLAAQARRGVRTP